MKCLEEKIVDDQNGGRRMKEGSIAEKIANCNFYQVQHENDLQVIHSKQ